jgi:hypothetical protein
MQIVENVDYELVPQEGETWGARILKGEFTETVVKIGTVKFLQDGMINFNFDILDSPDKALNTDDKDLQRLVGDILFSIITNELERKNERTGKDDTQESSD